MRRYAQSEQGREVGMRLGVQAVGEQLHDPRAAELAWRQRDAVDHQQ